MLIGLIVQLNVIFCDHTLIAPLLEDNRKLICLEVSD